jgi:chemotaxis protein CheD
LNSSEPLPATTMSLPATPPRQLYLQPGQVFASADPAVITTVLGSCVCVCLWDPRHGAGGANHYLLPERAGAEHSLRFGHAAMEELVKQMEGVGAPRRLLQAKLFGGASVIRSFANGNGHLGERNIEVARRFLERERIPVVAEDVGGRRGRKLLFDTRTGMVSVKLL